MIRAWAAQGPKQKLVPYECDPGQLGPEEVEIEVENCGICHSDLSQVRSWT
jgi:alcohol/geraniol dehydrogenase (NADP+)